MDLLGLCQQLLVEKGLADGGHAKRLAYEMKEIDAQNERPYFLDLYERKVRYPENQNNLLVPFALGIVDEFDITKEPHATFGDWPDIDTDYISLKVRDRLKERMAEIYGRQFVCNIGSYNTFGIKSALQNMARVFGKSRHEIVELTTKIGLKDEDGKPLTWDRALEMFPALKEYCEQNPDVADASQRLLNRNNSLGQHAAGLIIASVPIDNFVPLIKGKEGIPVSAWVEGLHGQDLGPMGLVKFDLLVITNLMQIALCCKLIKERYGLPSLCALPGQSDWSDISYLNDPKALAMADRGDMKCVFQFDSDGIREMVAAGGVTCFDDLVAYSALYRPGPMQCGMHTSYINRKRGKEPFVIHPKLLPILGNTYGIVSFQEQFMQMLNVVGDIPLKDCEILRKAISKKNEAYFAKYKEMFIANGQRNLGATKEEIETIWGLLASFASYAFNKSHACGYSYISARLLWLKAHYPLEFFAAILSCEDTSEKLKECKLEAERHGVCLKPVDINLSGVKFQIRDQPDQKSCIYFGLSNVKGIGESVAERIVAGQPYNGFQDFLTRFGTDASVLKPLVGLKAFPEADPITAYRYYEWFKKEKKKREDRKKRYENNAAKMQAVLQSLLPPSLWEALAKAEMFSPPFMEDLVRRMREWYAGSRQECEIDEKAVGELAKKYTKAADAFQKKIENDSTIPGLDQFVPDGAPPDEKLMAIFNSIELSEKQYYGFLWTHPLERSPDYEGNRTFLQLRQDKKPVGIVEVRLEQVSKLTSKKGTIYWLLNAEDVNGEVGYVQVWSDDWERFSGDLLTGQLCRLQVRPPDGGFNRYTLDSPARHKRHLLPKSKEFDFRVVVLRKGEG